MQDPSHAALYTLIAICLVMIGALLTTGVVSVEQRAVVLAGVISVLFAVAWRTRSRHDGGPKDEGD